MPCPGQKKFKSVEQKRKQTNKRKSKQVMIKLIESKNANAIAYEV